MVMRQATREMISKEMIQGATVGELLKRRMDELRSRFDEDSNA